LFLFVCYDADRFLQECFDEDGKFTAQSLAWILFRIGVFSGEQDKVEQELFPTSKTDDVVSGPIIANECAGVTVDTDTVSSTTTTFGTTVTESTSSTVDASVAIIDNDNEVIATINMTDSDDEDSDSDAVAIFPTNTLAMVNHRDALKSSKGKQELCAY
jgi:hypothetical protein